MKMKPEHFAELEQAIQRVQSEYPDVTLQSYLDAGRSGKRYRWDLLYCATRRGWFKIGDGKGCDGVPLYSYLTDSHIDTALRRIVARIAA